MQIQDTSFLRRRYYLQAGTLIFVLSMLSCAKVADPLPPIVQNPTGIQNLRIVETPSSNRLIFSLPGAAIEWVEVYRHCNPQVPLSRFQVISQIGQDELIRHDEPGSFRFEDRSRDREPKCRYAVRFVDRKGQRSDFSNVVAPEQSSPGGRS